MVVTIPLEIASQVKREAEKKLNAEQHKYPGKHILVVEDKRINMEIVKGFLEDTELIIDEARNGKEALEKVMASPEGSIDLISMLCKSGLVQTRSEGRRAIEQGGVTLGEEKITDVKASFGKDTFAGEGIVLKRGKKNFRKLILK